MPTRSALQVCSLSHVLHYSWLERHPGHYRPALVRLSSLIGGTVRVSIAMRYFEGVGNAVTARRVIAP